MSIVAALSGRPAPEARDDGIQRVPMLLVARERRRVRLVTLCPVEWAGVLISFHAPLP
jgi:hypothetical protein